VASASSGIGEHLRYLRPLRQNALLDDGRCKELTPWLPFLFGQDLPFSIRWRTAAFRRFEDCGRTLRLAEDVMIGTSDLTRIEVVVLPIAKVKCDFRGAGPRAAPQFTTVQARLDQGDRR